MTKFDFNKLETIHGISAASGLVFDQNTLYIIGDNSGFLHQYDLAKKQLTNFPLVKDAKQLTPKKSKSDFESITLHDGYLKIFGSGSTKKRNTQISFSIQNQSIIERDLKTLYKKFKEIANLSNDDLNIEGVVFDQNKQCFFQRGNGQNSQNGVFIITDNEVEFKSISLPFINKIESGFTDAVVHENNCYFLAAAENSNSTYFDGEVLGSVFGCMNLTTFEIEYWQQITTSKKMEGLTFYKNDAGSLTFLLCEDNDLNELKSDIYELIIYK